MQSLSKGLSQNHRSPRMGESPNAMGDQSRAQELLAIDADLSKRGIGLIVLSMGGEKLDTRNPTSGLTLTILAGVAECFASPYLQSEPRIRSPAHPLWFRRETIRTMVIHA
jgi:hypothetical protein